MIYDDYRSRKAPFSLTFYMIDDRIILFMFPKAEKYMYGMNSFWFMPEDKE